MNFENQRWFIGLMAMGLVLLILGSICYFAAGKDSETAKNNCSRSASGVVVISLVVMGMAAYFMFQENKSAGEFKLYYY